MTSKSMAVATIALALCGIAAAAQAPAVVSESLDNMIVSRPAEISGKLPIIFLAHNGGAKKEDWGDFPEELASKGFVVVNIGWTKSAGGADIVDSMKRAIERYSSSVDTQKAALIGGCHGCVKILAALGPSLPVKVQAFALLSMSEFYSPPRLHAPILAFYATSDHLGGGYVKNQMSVYEKTLTEPKTLVVLDATPHGNELATDDSTKVQVRGQIEAFLGQYLN